MNHKEALPFVLLILIVTATYLASCTSLNENVSVSPIDPPNTPVSDTEAIYCQIMPEFGEKEPLILLQDKTELRLSPDSNIDKEINFARHGLAGAEDESIFQDFKNRNRVPEPLVEQLSCEGSNIQMVKGERLAELLKYPGGWERLRKEFPGNPVVLVISAIGFNENSHRALVFMQWSSGGLSGSGDYYLMIKQGTDWRVSKKANRWAS